MKKYVGMCCFLVLCSIGVWYGGTVGALAWFGSTDKVVTHLEEDVIGSHIKDAQDPLREGTAIIAKDIGSTDATNKIWFSELDSTSTSREKTLNFARALVNYALAIVGLIALVYLLYHGFLTLTAAGKDDQAKKGRDGMQTAALALGGSALAWFLLSLVFWLIQKITQA